MATLRDVATQLNLSQAVVSRVLNGAKDARASEETRRRVFAAALALNYRPSATARALATGRTMQIGVLVGENQLREQNSIHGGEISGLMAEALLHHYRLSLLPLEAGSIGASRLRDWINDRNCDAFCLFSNHLGAGELNVLRDCTLPRVIFGDPRESDDTLGATVVDFDNHAYAHEATAWLGAQGHSRIAWATSVGETDQPHTILLRQGYSEALRERGGEPLVWPFTPHDAAMLELVRANGATAAIVRGYHSMTGWITTLLEAGYKLPGDFHLLALLSEEEFDYALLGGMLRYAAVHIHSPRSAGILAAKLLIGGIAGDTMRPRALVASSREPFWGDPTHMAPTGGS